MRKYECYKLDTLTIFFYYYYCPVSRIYGQVRKIERADKVSRGGDELLGDLRKKKKKH